MKSTKRILWRDYHCVEGCDVSVVKAGGSEEIEWMLGEPECNILNVHNIKHVGYMLARAPMEVTRVDSDGSYFMACIEGQGVILSDGKWVHLKAGQATLLPPFMLNSIHCEEGQEWKFCWVRYEEEKRHAPISSIVSPAVIPYDPAPLCAAIRGLYAECRTEKKRSVEHLWVDIIHKYVLDFAATDQHDERLYRLWLEVEKSMSHPWVLQDLARVAGMSAEHLRRRCTELIGRTPMQQLTFLRMQRARHLLVSTDHKIGVIARDVGYQSPYNFSDTFKKWMGQRPSELRKGD